MNVDDGTDNATDLPDTEPVPSIVVEFSEEDAFAKIVRVNPAFERFTGYTAATVKGSPLKSLYSEYVGSTAVNALEAALVSGNNWNGHINIRRRNGRIRRLFCTVRIIGNGNRFIVTLHTNEPEREIGPEEDILHDLIGPTMMHVSQAVLVIDSTQRIVAANPAASEVFGWPPSELEGMRLDRLLPPRFRSVHGSYFKHFASTARRGKMMGERAEISAIRQDGTEFPAEASIFPIFHSSGTFFGTVLRDISTRKAYEAELEASRLRFRALFDLSYQFVWLLDSHGALVESNRPSLEFIGMTADQAPGDLFTKTPWFDKSLTARVQVSEALSRAMAGESSRGTIELVNRNGNTHVFDYSTRPVFDDEDDLQHIIVEARDITQISEAMERLRRSEHHLRNAQSIGKMGNWYWEVESGVLYWSDEVYRIFGFEPGAFEPSYEQFLQCIHPDDRQLVETAIQDAFSGNGDYAVRHRILRSNSGEAVVREEGQVTFDDDGVPTAIQGVVQDVSEEHFREFALRRAQSEAVAANAAKSDFLARMSHELRTPLNAVLGYSEMLCEEMIGPLGNSKYRDYAGNIRESGKQLLSLVNTLLDASRLEIGGYSVEISPTPVRRCVRDALATTWPIAQKKSVRLRARIGHRLPPVMADAGAVRQILINLISNSIKFTPPGGSVVVSAEHDPEASKVILTVVDKGSGIPPELIPKLGTPFVNEAEVYSKPEHGAGLGWAIVKGLARAMDAETSIESEIGIGTQVFLRFRTELSVPDEAEPTGVRASEFNR